MHDGRHGRKYQRDEPDGGQASPVLFPGIEICCCCCGNGVGRRCSWSLKLLLLLIWVGRQVFGHLVCTDFGCCRSFYCLRLIRHSQEKQRRIVAPIIVTVRECRASRLCRETADFLRYQESQNSRPQRKAFHHWPLGCHIMAGTGILWPANREGRIVVLCFVCLCGRWRQAR